MSGEGVAPLRLLALSELSGDAPPAERALAVDPQRFDEVMAQVAPKLALRVRDRLSGGAEPLDVALRFAGLRDFAPAALAAQLPLLARLAELRALADELAAGKTQAADVRARIAGAVPAPLARALSQKLDEPQVRPPPAAGGPPATSSASVDAILARVSAPASDARSSARRAVDLLTTRPGGRAAPGPAGALRGEIDALVAAQLGEILHAPAFRRLESAWRGLRLLVSRSDFRAGIELFAACAAPARAAAVLEEACAERDFDAVLVDCELDASARDLAIAQALGAAGAAAQTPVCAALAPAFFGLESWSGARRMRAPHLMFDEPAYAGWKSFQEREESRWLALVANRIVARAPYGPDGESARGFAYAESGPAAALFGSPVWALGSLLARAFARTGQCVQLAGTRNGLVPDLPLVAVPEADAPAPVEGVFGNERREDFERIGVAALQLYQRDIAFFGALRTFHRPERYADADASADAVQHAQLAYQLYASRLVKFLGRAVPELIGLPGAEQVAAALKQRLIAFLSTKDAPFPAQRVGVAAKPNADDPALTDLKLRVGPEMRIAGRDVNVMFAFSARLA